MKKKKTTIPSINKWVIALILVVMQVYPFFYVFTSSFKSLDDFRQLPAYALPSKWVLTNFINVFTKSHMLTYFKNSIIVLIGVLIPLLLFRSLCHTRFSCFIHSANSSLKKCWKQRSLMDVHR